MVHCFFMFKPLFSFDITKIRPVERNLFTFMLGKMKTRFILSLSRQFNFYVCNMFFNRKKRYTSFNYLHLFQKTFNEKGLSADALVGEGLFNQHCGRCHDLPVIADYSAERWDRILPSMAKKSRDRKST